MARKKVFDLMIDFNIFGQSLSDFVKAYLKVLGRYALGDLVSLWKIAKRQANAILKA